MEFFKKCDACKKRVIIIKVRHFTSKGIPHGITSQKKLCRKCAKQIQKMLPQ